MLSIRDPSVTANPASRMTISRAEAIRRLSQVLPLERQYEALKTENVCLHTELRHQQNFVSRLKFLLSERLNKIDQLNATIDRLREQNRRLDAEAEHYAEMVKAS
jgi:hypothetical protein